MRIMKTFLTAAVAVLVCAVWTAAPAGATVHLSDRDINCPYWEAKESWAGYPMVGASANVVCVQEYWGRIWGGGAFDERRPPLYAGLNLWRYANGRYNVEAATGFRLDSCQNRSVDFSRYILHVDGVQLCGGTALVHTKVCPPHGYYHLEVIVKSLTGEQLIDVNSDGRCF